MNSEDSVTVSVGEALLDFLAASAPELSGVSEVDGYVISSDSNVDESTTGIEPVDGTLVFGYLLHEQLIFERNLTECRYLIDMPVHDGLVFVTDEDMNVRCFMGAIVYQEDDRRFSIEFNPPFVDHLIGGNAQRPLADRIRVCAYLVRLAGKAVGILGEPLRVTGDPVGFLRRAVRLLRELVRLARLQDRDNGCDNSGPAADGTASRPEHIPIHDTDSTHTEVE